MLCSIEPQSELLPIISVRANPIDSRCSIVLVNHANRDWRLHAIILTRVVQHYTISIHQIDCRVEEPKTRGGM